MGLSVDTSVQYLKGIGPKRAARLEKLGIRTIEDLLFHIPHRYIDRSKPIPILQAEIGAQATFVVKVMGSSFRRTRRGPVVQILVSDKSSQLYAVWFNRPDLASKFKPGENILLSGQVSFYGQRQMVNPFFEKLDEHPNFFERAIFSVYPLTEGLAAWELGKAVNKALDAVDDIPETLPRDIMYWRRLPGIKDALCKIHRPAKMQDLNDALKRLRYEELFYFQLLIALYRQGENEQPSQALQVDKVLMEQFEKIVGFEFTRGQKKAIEDICSDIAKPKAMHRLLQGDVGSGKTVVAIYAMTAAISCDSMKHRSKSESVVIKSSLAETYNMQAVIMAPTEILAEQHYAGWREKLEALGIKSVLLTGSMKAKEKASVREAIAAGDAGIIFGTHSLIQENVVFKNLVLAVVDEQHRFGVMQRAALAEKAELKPHVLVMSATPIPRTLTLSYYGDLDISVIREKPLGRGKRTTRIAYDSRKKGVYKWLQESLQRGERAFVVCPLIEESEKLELSSAKQTYDELSTILKQNKIALVHGKIAAAERSRIMEAFRLGEIDLLVSTTVIEVGVDIPEATIMIIRHPERFGLAQLHQLRGRIGRGTRPATCVLLLPSTLSVEAKSRLEFFASVEDGFKLAEEDLRIRGPGQIMGTRQHGLPDLKIADLIRDRELMLQAREDAFRIIADDPKLHKYPELKDVISRRYPHSMEFLSIA